MCDHIFEISVSDSIHTLPQRVKRNLEKARELGARTVVILPHDPSSLTFQITNLYL